METLKQHIDSQARGAVAHLRGRDKALATFGWTGERAAWIALVCLHSGAFTRAQCARFLDAHPEQVRRVVHALIAQGLAAEETVPGIRGIGRVCRIFSRGSTERSEPSTSATAATASRRRAHAPPALARLRDRALRVCPGLPTEPEKVAAFEALGIERELLPVSASTAAPPGTRAALLPSSSCRSHWTRTVQCSSTSIPATTPRPRSVPGERRTAGSGTRSREQRPVHRGRRRRPHFAREMDRALTIRR